MNCPFCHCANAATSRACRVCGAPLNVVKPEVAPLSVISTPVELARQSFDENAAPLISASFLPAENPTICLVRENGVVQMWDAQSDELSSFSIGRRLRKLSPICCALSSSNFIATGHQNGLVRWHDFGGREWKSPSSHIGRVLSLAANPTHLYSGGSDGVIWATALDDNRKAQSCAIIEGLGALTTFAASPDASLIAVGCDDGAVELWRVNADKTMAKLDWTRRGHDSPIRSLSFSPNGQMIVSRDKVGNLCLWAAQTSYQLPLPPQAQCSHAAPAFSRDNQLLALANAKNGVAIFDVAPGTLVCELPPLGEAITHLAFAMGAAWLLVAGAREVVIWEICVETQIYRV